MRRPPVFAGARIALFARLVGNGLLQVAVVLGAGLLASRLIGPSTGTQPAREGLLLAVCAVLLFALRWLERVDAAQLAQSYVLELRRGIFARLWHSRVHDGARRGRGALLLRLMGDMGSIGRWVGQGLARIVVTGVMVGGVCVALLWLEPWLAGVALGIVALLATVALLVRRPLDAAVRDARNARGRLATDASDRLHALAAIQASGAWRAEQSLIERRSRRVRSSVVAETRWSACLLATSEVVGLLAPTLAIVAVALIPGASGSLGALPAVIALFGLLVTPLRDSMRVFDYWRKARIAFEKVEQMLGLPRLPRARVSPPLALGPVDEIAVEGLRLDARAPLLDLYARRGARVLVHGAGQGPSQLLRMLVRLVDPQAGRIRIDGRDLRDVDLVSLRSRVALVSPTLGLQRGPTRRLLCLRRPAATPAQIEAVLRRCRLDAPLRQLGAGLETRLEEGWPQVAPAVRLRLLLAQALLGEPDVLLLDDIDGVLPVAQSHELRAMLSGFRGIVVLVSSESRWRSWATVDWNLDEPGPLVPPVLLAGDRS